MELAPLPKDAYDLFVPDLTEGAEAGLYLSLFELMNEGLIIASDETILEVNSAACRLMERSYRDLAGQPLTTLFASERAFLSARNTLFIQGEMRGSLRVTLPGGRERDLAYVAAARIRPGVHALILSADPVTGVSPQAARAADTVWPRLAAALDQAALVIDARDHIIAANAPARHKFGAADTSLTGYPLSALCTLSDPARESGPVNVQPADGSPAMRGRLLPGPEPGWRILLLSDRAPLVPIDANVSGAFRLPAAQPRTERGSPGDTPAPHRLQSCFDEAAQAAARGQQVCALMCLDIDGLTQDVTPPDGRPDDDALGQQLAARMSTCGASVECMRVSADRFMAVVTNVASMREVSRAVDRARGALTAPFTVDTKALALNASVGVAVYPADGATFSLLTERATAAMQRARLDGANGCLFHNAATNAARFEHAALQSALAQAIDHDALAIHFQPVRDVSTGGLVAAEALLRWNHPDLGQLSPRDFMNSAEDAGHGLAIGWHAVRLACSHAAEWHRAGVAIPVAIAISAHMLAQDDMLERLGSALRDTTLPASAIELNLPEICLCEDTDRLQRTLLAIDRLGIRLAITAIGNRPLPIGRLHRLPIGTFKLDRELIRDLSRTGDGMVLAATISAIKALSRSVQAVGIETEAQAQQLLELGCERQQGRFYAPPLPADDFAQLL